MSIAITNHDTSVTVAHTYTVSDAGTLPRVPTVTALKRRRSIWSSSAQHTIRLALEVIFNVMRSINPRFTYLLTYLLTRRETWPDERLSTDPRRLWSFLEWIVEVPPLEGNERERPLFSKCS